MSKETQEKNNVHNHRYVIAAVAVLQVYMYLFTHIDGSLGVPSAHDLADRLGITIENVFDDDRNVDCDIHVSYNSDAYSNDDERLVLFAGITVAFLFVYYVPLAYMQHSLVVLTCLLRFVLYDFSGIALFIATHSAVFLILHPVDT